MKRTFFYLIPAFTLIAVVFGFQSKAMADDWDLKTTFSINQPILIPGHVVLPTGSYVIKRLNTVTPVVQILNESETKVYATVLTNLDFVMNPPHKPVFTFQEMPDGPPSLKSWDYPGRETAYEFNYR